MGLAIWVFLAVNAAWFALLLGILAGRPWLVCSLNTVLSRLLPSFSFLHILTAYLAAHDLCRANDFGTALRVVPAEAGVANAMMTPAILFGAFLLQGIMQVLSSTRNVLTTTPALTVQLITLFFYTTEWAQPSCGLLTRWPRAQGTFVPLHYALWLCSVSNQVMTLFALERSLFARRHVEGPATASAGHRTCCVALLSVASMLWCSEVGEAYHGHMATAVLWMSASTVSFYVLIATGIWMPLRACQLRAYRSDDPARKSSASRFLWVSAYLGLIWHGFPAVWLANALGLTTDMEYRIGYIVTDVLAKFLPPSLYLAVATTP